MKILFDLNQLVDYRRINVLGVSQDKTDELFELIRNGEIQNAEEGQQHFYADDSGAAKNFSWLKNNLRDRMINTLFCTEVSNDKYVKLYYDTLKKEYAARMLIKNSKRKAAARIAREALKVAVKHHFVDLVVALSRKLAHYHAVGDTNRSQYRKYQKILEEYTELEYWDHRARDHYHHLAMELNLAKTIKPDLIEQAKTYKAELDTVKDRVLTMDFQLYRINIAIFLYKMLNQSAEIVEVCLEGIRYFEQLPFEPPPRMKRSFYFNMLPVYLQLGKYEEAQALIGQLKTIISEGSLNWIGLHSYQSILGFHWQRPALVREAIAAIYQSEYSAVMEQELKIYEAYLAILEGETPKLGKLLNETPHFTFDKKGMNINLLVLQLLIFLKRDDRPAIIDRLDALQAYAYRYLEKDQTTQRSKTFFRMLYLLAKSVYQVEEVERRSPGIVKKLHETPRHISAIDVELVPYELLWDKVAAWCGQPLATATVK